MIDVVCFGKKYFSVSEKTIGGNEHFLELFLHVFGKIKDEEVKKRWNSILGWALWKLKGNKKLPSFGHNETGWVQILTNTTIAEAVVILKEAPEVLEDEEDE